MAANLTKIPILKRPPLHKLYESLMSDDDQPTLVSVTLGKSNPRKKNSSKKVWVFITRLHRDRLSGTVVFGGSVCRKEEGQWRTEYHCAGTIYLRNQDLLSNGWLVNLEGSDIFTDCTDSPLPAVRWRRAMQDADEILADLVGDRFLGSEIVRRTIDILSDGMRRMPSVCSKCGAEVEISEWGDQPATCPNCGFLDDGEDLMVYALPRIRRQSA
jgi:hypothetical protein